MSPQEKSVYEYMRRHGVITAADAVRELGVYRLAARIADLRRRGVDIEATLVSRCDKRWAEYRLVRS